MEENQSFLELQVDQETSTNLTETSRWAKFLGVLILCGFGLFLLLLVALWQPLMQKAFINSDMGSDYTNGVMIGVGLVLLFLLAIVVILMSFLIKGAVRIRNGIRDKDTSVLNSGLASLRNYFAMLGVLFIISTLLTLFQFLNR